MIALIGHKLGLIQPYYDKKCNNYGWKQIGQLKDFYFSLDLGLASYQDSYSVSEQILTDYKDDFFLLFIKISYPFSQK